VQQVDGPLVDGQGPAVLLLDRGRHFAGLSFVAQIAE
jgi:hypothetical protein